MFVRENRFARRGLVQRRLTQPRLAQRRRHGLVCFISPFLLFASGWSVPEALTQTLQIINVEGHSTNVTAAQIESLPHVTLDTHDHDKPARFEGVPMSALLSIAGIQFGDTMRGPRMTEALLVEGADGYKVVFARAELDPAFATREIILANKRDGKPLDAKEGPFRIVAPGDKRPARWIRQVTTLRVIAIK
jgi:hypothetical protein